MDEKEEKREKSKKKPSHIKKKSFIKTRKGQLILGAIAVSAILYVTFFMETAQEPQVWGLKPIYFILLISTLLSIFVTLVYKFMTDQSLMKELKSQLKSHQKEMKKHRDNPSKMSEISKKSMHINMKYMKQSFKPMLITLLPFLLIFTWLRGVFDGTVVLPLSFWPGHLGWIGVYIIFSMVFTTIFRKMAGVA